MKLLFPIFFVLLTGFKFNPMSQSIELGENQKSAQFLIENDTNESMPIEVSASDRIMDENGKETLSKAKEVTVFPPQMIVPAKERRTIRVNWIGADKLDFERAFRVVAEQLPLEIDEKTKKRSGIKMLMRYMAALYVTPKDAEAKLHVTILQSDANSLKVSISNDGAKHQVLINPVLSFKKGNEKWSLKDKDLGVLSGENVLAHGKRTFTIPTKQKIPLDSAVTLKVDE